MFDRLLGCAVKGNAVALIDLGVIDRRFESWLYVVALGKLLTLLCIRHQAVQFGIGQGAAAFFNWEVQD